MYCTVMFQLYPFGVPNGDDALSLGYFSDFTYSTVTLTKRLYFYEEIIKTAYVS